jgi:PAS domain S-box-containing protein
MKNTDLLIDTSLTGEQTVLSNLRAVLNSITEGFFLLSADFHIVLLNKQGAHFIHNVSGIFPKKGDNILDVIPAEKKEQAKMVLLNVINGQSQEFDITARPNGKFVNFTISCTPIITDNSNTGICIIAKDITEKKNAEYLLKKSERRWKFALDGSGNGVWEYNFQTGETFYSSSYKQILGFKDEEFKNDSDEWRSRIHPDDIAIVEQIDQEYADGHIEKHNTEYRIKNKSGYYIWVQDKGMLVEKTGDGKPGILIGTQTDINEKKVAEEALKKVNERFISFMENTPTLTWIIDDTARFRYINKPYMRAFNLDAEAIGKSIYEIFPKEICDVYVANNNRVWESGTALETIEEGIAPDGSGLILQISKFPLTPEGDLRLLGGTALDITQLHNAKEELLISNERYYYADKATSDAIWDWNIIDNKIIWGEAYRTLFGHTGTDLDFEFYGQYIHPEDKEEVLKSLEESIAGQKEQWTKEYRFRCGNGTYKYVLDKGYLIRNKDKIAVRMIGAMQDITEQRYLERTLLEEKELRQKEIMKAVMDAQENERYEVSYELHESINQILASSKMMLGVEQEKKKSNSFIVQASENIQKAMDEIRNISYRLNPAIIQLVGLKGALTDLAEKTGSAHNLKITFNHKISNIKISYPLQIAVFRIVQAQLDNIVKHAGATEARISLAVMKNDLMLTVADNGTGFDEKLSPKKLGLQNIFNRVHFHNGEVHIKTGLGKGCVLEAKFGLIG